MRPEEWIEKKLSQLLAAFHRALGVDNYVLSQVGRGGRKEQSGQEMGGPARATF